MFDCIVSYHMNPLTCGVAKFNHIIAKRLGVPLLNLFDPKVAESRAPLLSIKISEFFEKDLDRLHRLVQSLPATCQPRVFFHDFSDTVTEYDLLKLSKVVYCGNHEIFERLSAISSKVVKMWSPGTLGGEEFEGAALPEIKVFTFGMAHKLRATYYSRLKDLLDKTGKPYTLWISTALHEGTSYEGMFSAAFEQLAEIFGDKVRFLGFLSDGAVREYLARSDYFAAFFDKGVRDNNSSVNAAMEIGAVVISNLDPNSPKALEHGYNILDINKVEHLPTDLESMQRLSDNAKGTASSLGWDQFLAQMSAIEGGAEGQA